MTILEILEIIRVITLIVIILFALILAVITTMRAKRGFTRRQVGYLVFCLGLLFITYIAITAREIQPADWAQIMLTLGLVAVTGSYAFSAVKQADASVKMAEEMREQRYDAVRPVIDIYRDPADDDKMPEAIAASEGDASRGLSCVLKNIGLGPAIDLRSFVQNPISGERQHHDFGTLAIGKTTYRVKLSLIHEGSPLALLAYYKDVYGRTFKSSREVTIDKEKGWEIDSLHIRLVENGERID